MSDLRIKDITVRHKTSATRLGFLRQPPKTSGHSSTFRKKHQNLRDRKSTRLNSSHVAISYAVFCLKKKRKHNGKRINIICRCSSVTLAYCTFISYHSVAAH